MKITEEHKKVVKKHIDEYNYGILKEDLTDEEHKIMKELCLNNYFIDFEKSYLPTMRSNYGLLNVKNKNSDRVVELRKKKVKMWSFSELNQWVDCELNYKLQRVDRVQGKPSGYAYYGSLAHDILENYILKNISKEECKEIFTKRLKRLKKLGLRLPKDSRGGNTIQDNYESSLYDYWQRNFINLDKKYRTEVEVFNEIMGEYLIGFIDLLVINRKENDVYYVDLLDFKTSSMKNSKTAKEEDLKEKSRQLLLYKYLIEKTFPNIKVERVGWDFLKYIKITWKDDTFIKERKHNYLMDFEKRMIKELGIEQQNYIQDCILAYEIPRELHNIMRMDNCIVYYNYSDSDIVEIVRFVEETTDRIKKALNNSNYIYNFKNYEDESFYCNNLCLNKEHCPHLKEIGVIHTGKNLNETMKNILSKVKERK